MPRGKLGSVVLVVAERGGPYGDGRVRVVAEQPVEAEPVEELVLGGSVARGAEVDRVRRVALPEVGRQEGVLVAERPGVDDEAGRWASRDELVGGSRLPGGVARDDEVLVRADAVGVAGDLRRPAGVARSA